MTVSESDGRDWDDLPADPEPEDLGYDPMELDITESSADGGHYVILPHDEDFLRQEAFIVADSESVSNLDEML
jgi:hypothetical protein